ncbi:hypothetical protein DTO271D3_9227 [Paecilomyces variotii]|nr:hypothetical protein DTO271D3_9227 [Paecilomyces variotii]
MPATIRSRDRAGLAAPTPSRVPGSRAREPLPGGTPAPRPLCLPAPCLPAPPASPRTVPPKADSSRPIVNWRRPTPRQSLSPPSPRPGPPAGCPGGPPAPGATARSSPPASPYGPVTGRRGTSFPPSTLPGCDRDRLRSRAGPLPACPETAGSLPPAVAPGHSSFLIDSPTSIELGSCVQRFPCPKVAAGERFCMGKTHHMGHSPPYKVGHFVRAAKALDRVGQQLADPGSLQRWSVRGTFNCTCPERPPPGKGHVTVPASPHRLPPGKTFNGTAVMPGVNTTAT